jgi:soluble lytic murein transglycosylase-like protein
MAKLLLLLQIPVAAWQYQRTMTQSAYRFFGPGAPVATLAGQIHQESRWEANVTARDGGMGLAQFMPKTAEGIARQYPQDCYPVNAYDPRWAFMCRDRFMTDMLRSVKPMTAGGLTVCSHWAFAFRAYNGGGGWLDRDRRLAAANGANPDRYLQVAAYNAGRNPLNHKINTLYPTQIYTYGKRYEAAGWGPNVECR